MTESVESVLKTIDSMQKEGASAQDVGQFVHDTGYDPKALSQAFKTYKETGEIDIAGGGTSFLQGLTFGFSEELGGLVEMATGGNYDEYVTRQRNKMKLYQKQNPVISSAFEVLGTIPTMLLPAGWIAKTGQATTKVATAVRGGAAAGIEGAVYGAGTGEGVDGKLAGATETGLLSAVVGAPVALGGRALSQRLARGKLTPEQQAVESLTKRLSPETMAAVETPKVAQAGVALADVGDEPARYLRGIRAADSQASQFIDETLTNRWKDQYKRVTNLVNDAFDSDPELAKAMKDGIKDMKDAAGLAYGKLYNDFLDLTDEGIGNSIKNDKLLSSYWDEATKAIAQEAADRGDQVKALAFKELPKAAEITADTKLPLEVLDNIKKYVGDDITRAARSNDVKAGQLQRGLIAKQRNFVAQIDDVTDNAYAVTRSNFAEPAKMEEALELGRGAMRKGMTADEIRAQIADYTGQEAKAYMAGVMTSINNTIRNTGFSNDVLRNLVNTPEMVAKLKAMMPNEAAWKRFSAAIENEARQVRTKNLVMGGSNTADKLQDVKGVDTLLDDAINIMTDPTGIDASATMMRRINQFAKNLVERIRSSSNERSLHAQMLLETDPIKKKELATAVKEARERLAQRAMQSQRTGAAVGATVGAKAGMLYQKGETWEE